MSNTPTSHHLWIKKLDETFISGGFAAHTHELPLWSKFRRLKQSSGNYQRLQTNLNYLQLFWKLQNRVLETTNNFKHSSGNFYQLETEFWKPLTTWTLYDRAQRRQALNFQLERLLFKNRFKGILTKHLVFEIVAQPTYNILKSNEKHNLGMWFWMLHKYLHIQCFIKFVFLRIPSFTKRIFFLSRSVFVGGWMFCNTLLLRKS